MLEEETKFYYKVILSYRGTNYCGWQFQTVNPETVQEYVQKVVEKIAKYQSYQVIGASRTDAGVHASAQTLKVILPREVSPEHLTMGMNSMLPDDIKVVSSEFIDKSFNPNRDPISKEYHYYFIPNKQVNATLSETIYYVPGELNMALINEACAYLVGKHNFENYCVKGSRNPVMIREIVSCSIEKTSFDPIESEIFYLKIMATGYLKYMVRFIMGALINIGKENLSLDEFKNSLKDDQICKFKLRAPAHGLHLHKINY